MKKQQHTKLALGRETLLLLTHGELTDIAGGRIATSHISDCDSADCPTKIPLTDRCQSITCANC